MYKFINVVPIAPPPPLRILFWLYVLVWELHILTSFQLHTSIQWYANMKTVVTRGGVFLDRKTVPNVSRFMYFISHKYKPSWSFAKEKYMYKISVFKSIVGVLTPQDIFKWLCQIYNYNLTQVHRQVTVSVLFYVADCSLHNNLSKLSYYFRTHLQLRLCELWSIYTKKICFNKQIQYF